MEHVDKACVQLGLDQYGEIPLIKEASKRTGLNHKHLVLIIVALMALSAISTHTGMWMVSTLNSFIMPCYYSFIAIETKDILDDKKWLTYWVVFAFVHYFDSIFQKVFFFVPFYPLVRAAFLFYIYKIKKNGIEYFYDKVIAGLFNKIEPYIRKVVVAFEDVAEMEEEEDIQQAKEK